MPSHTHNLYSNDTWGDASVGFRQSSSNSSGISAVKNGRNGSKGYYNSTYNDSTQLVQNSGGGASHNNMMPYKVVYMYKRIS